MQLKKPKHLFYLYLLAMLNASFVFANFNQQMSEALLKIGKNPNADITPKLNTLNSALQLDMQQQTQSFSFLRNSKKNYPKIENQNLSKEQRTELLVGRLWNNLHDKKPFFAPETKNTTKVLPPNKQKNTSPTVENVFPLIFPNIKKKARH